MAFHRVPAPLPPCYQSISPAFRALSSKSTDRRFCSQSMGQTDGWTDVQTDEEVRLSVAVCKKVGLLFIHDRTHLLQKNDKVPTNPARTQVFAQKWHANDKTGNARNTSEQVLSPSAYLLVYIFSYPKFEHPGTWIRNESVPEIIINDTVKFLELQSA